MQRRKLYLLTALQVIALVVLVGVVFTIKRRLSAPQYAGTLLVILGTVFVTIARHQLGESFSITPQAHKLVTTGLYAKIRNPIYVFGTVALAGLILLLQRPSLWVLLAVLVAAQTIRATREARVLEAAFGEAYREYRRKTWF